ncbi:MAG: fibronectin type III domain-containing protein, partial [Actinomycetes bacterium]
VDEFSYEMRYLDGSLHSGTVKVVGISSQAACPEPSAAPILRYVPRGTQNLKISLLSAISDPCGRTVSIGEVFGASSCISVKVGHAGSEGQLSLNGLDTCSGASASLSYRFSAGASPLQSSTVTILLNAVSISQMTARSNLALLAPGESVQLGTFVTGNIGALSFSRTTGTCSVSNDGTLSAPAQSDATSISSCGFKATDGATGQSVGGVVWLAGKTPIIEQLRSDPIIVPSLGGSKTVDLLRGSQPYFTALPTSVQVVERSQPVLDGCDAAAGTVTSSGDSSVTLHGAQGLQHSQTCRLIVTLGVGSLIDRETFGISVVFQGAQPPKLLSCPLPTLHPAIRVIWDLSSCLDPGGYDISSLSLKVTGSSLVTVDTSQLQGGAPSLSLLPDSNSAGQQATITLAVSDGVNGKDTKEYSQTIQPAPCEVSSTPSLVTLHPGESQTVPAIVVVTGSDSCQWKLTSAAVTTVGTKDSTAQISSSNDHKIDLRAGTPDGGSQIHFTVGYRAVISTDSSIFTSGTIEVTVLSKPAPPQSVAAFLVEGGGKLNVSWVPPTLRGDDPENPLTYELQCSSTDGGSCDPSPCLGTTATTCLVSGLSNGKTYQFRVRAKNSVGWSDWSELSAGKRPATAPGAPDAPTVSNRSGTIDVAWGAPNSNGSTIIGYTVQYLLLGQGQDWQGGCTTSGVTSVNCSISIPLGIGSQFRVRADSSDQDSGSFSLSSVSIKASTTPAQANVTAAPGSQDGEILATWGAPDSNGSDITRYAVQHSRDNSTWVN